MGKVITVAQQKGGAGKTTLAVTLAGAFVARGLSVALLDSDPQGTLGRWFMARVAARGTPDMEFSTASAWTFEPVDDEVFPAIRVAREAGTAGGSLTAVYNAANEVAAQAFLDGALRFDRIVPTIAEVLAAADEWRSPPGSVDEVFAADQWARTRAAAVVGATELNQ